MKGKKGNSYAVLFILFALFIVLLVGITVSFVVSVIDWTADEIVPELSGLGMVGDSNLTEYAEYSISPANEFIQQLSWIGGLIYIVALIGLLGLAFVFRFTGNKWLIIFFIVTMLLLVIAAIFVSNIYEDFYDGTGEIGTRLKEQSLLSWLVLYSPVVICVIGFFAGVIMFTGEGGEEVI